MADKTLNITLVKSTIGSKPKHKATAEALGLTRMHKTVTQKDNVAIRGMIAKISHLVKVEEV